MRLTWTNSKFQIGEMNGCTVNYRIFAWLERLTLIQDEAQSYGKHVHRNMCG